MYRVGGLLSLLPSPRSFIGRVIVINEKRQKSFKDEVEKKLSLEQFFFWPKKTILGENKKEGETIFIFIADVSFFEGFLNLA